MALPETQDELDELIQKRLERQADKLEKLKVESRKWEGRAKRSHADVDTWRREARRWENHAKANLAVIKAHEATIQKFIDRLDDVLSEEEDDD